MCYFQKEMKIIKIAIGCDPNAQSAKEDLIKYLNDKNYGEITDFGSEDPIYANTAITVAKAVASGEYDRGILICGTGLGVSIAANKVKGAYAACIHDVYQAQRAELSNHANIITMGAQVVGIELAKCMVKEYLSCTYDPNCRSKDKVQRIVDFENEQ